MLQEFVPAENLESLDLGWNPIDEKGFEAWEGLRVAGSSKQRLVAQNLELAVLALARIMCANIHSQNGTAILAQELLSRK